jgi:hypothetical protein
LRTDFADYLQRPNLVLSEDGELDEGLHAAGIHVAQPAASIGAATTPPGTAPIRR